MKTWTKRLIAVLCCVVMVTTSIYIGQPQNAKAASTVDTYDFNGTAFSTALLDGEGSSDGSSASIPLHADNLATLLTDTTGVPEGFEGSVYGGGKNGSYASVPVNFANPINLSKVTSVKIRMYANGSGVSSDQVRIFSQNSTTNNDYEKLLYTTDGGGVAQTWCEIDITSILNNTKIAKNDDGYLERFIIGYRIYGNSTTCYFDSIIIEGEDYFVETADIYDFNGTDFDTSVLAGEGSGPLKAERLATLITDASAVPEGFTDSVYGGGSYEYASVPVCFNDTIDLSKVTSIKVRMYVTSYTATDTPNLRVCSEDSTNNGTYEKITDDAAGITHGQWCEVDITDALNSIAKDENGYLTRFVLAYRFYSTDTQTCYYDYISITGTNYIVSQESDDSDTETTEFTQITISDFVDSDGNKMPEGTYEGGSSVRDKYYVPNLTNFDKVQISMNVKFGTGGNGSRIEIGGISDGKGYAIYPNGAGNLQFIDVNGLTETYNCGYVATGTEGIKTFIDTEFLLQLSFEYGDYDNGGTTNDVKIGVYIEGVEYSGSPFIIYNWDTSKMGNYLSVYRNTTSDSVTIGSVESDDSETETESKNITISDFVDSSGNVMAAGEYSYISTHIDTFYLNGLTSFDNTTLSMRVKYKYGTDATRIQIAGNATNKGFLIYLNSYGNLIIAANTDYTGVSSFDALSILASSADLTSFVGEEFILQISFEYGNFDSGSSENDIKLGVAINGATFQYHTFYNCNMSYFGNHLALYRSNEASSITVAPVDTDPVVYDFNGTDFDTTVYASEGGVALKEANLAKKLTDTSAVPEGFTDSVYGGGSADYASVPVYFEKPINLSRVISIKVRMYVPTYSSSDSAVLRVMTNENDHNATYTEAAYEDIGGTFGAWSEVDITDMLKDENTVKDANGYMGRFILAFCTGEAITCYFDSIIIDGVDYFVSEEGTFRDITLVKLGTDSGFNSETSVWDIYPIPDNPTNVPGAEGVTTFDAAYEIDGTSYTGTFTRSNNTNGLYITIPASELPSDADGVIVTIKAGEYAPNGTTAGICITEDYAIYLHEGEMTQYEGEEHCEADDEVYVVGEGDDIMIDGVSVSSGDKYTKSGVHLVTYSVDGYNYSKHIIIYHYGDMNDDGEVNVKDLVAMKKYIADDRDVTKAGEKAADMNVDDETTTEDTELLRKRLITDSGALVLCPTDGRVVAKADDVAAEYYANYYVGKADAFGTDPITCGRDATVLKWISFENVSSYTVKLATKEDMSDAVAYEATSCTLELMNLLADTDYYWTVTAGDYVSDVQTFHTQKTIRTITIENVANVRDGGGWATEDGKYVKQGMFYRGGKIDNIAEDGIDVMVNQLGIKMDLDLRNSGEESAGSTSPLGTGVTYLNVGGPYYWNSERGINAEAYKEALLTEIRAFADKDNYPIYVHCSIGRDRTGTLCFLINALLGVSEQDLIMDYEFSTLSLSRTGTSTATKLTATFKDMYDNVKAYAPDGTMAEATEAFMLELGVTQDEIDSIRSILLEEK